MRVLPGEIVSMVVDCMDARTLVNARAVNRQWQRLIDGDEASALSHTTRLAQGKMAALYTQLPEAGPHDVSHPGHRLETLPEHNAAWMQRDFGAAFHAALHNDHDLSREPAYRFDLQGLTLAAYGEDVRLDDNLEPELHNGHLLISYGSVDEGSFGILDIDLNILDPAQVRHLKCRDRWLELETGEVSALPTPQAIPGLRRLSWPVPIQAWGYSRDTNELVIVCYHKVDPPYVLEEDCFVVHVVDLTTLQPSQPATQHRVGFPCESISTMKIAENMIILGIAEDTPVAMNDYDAYEAHLERPTVAAAVVLQLKPEVKIMAILPQHAGTELPARDNFAGSAQDASSSHTSEDSGWHRYPTTMEDAAILDTDLFVTIGIPLREDTHERQIGLAQLCLNIYKPEHDREPRLLARQPVSVRSPFSWSSVNSDNQTFVQDVRITIEPCSAGPIILTVHWAMRQRQPFRHNQRRDRVFLNRAVLMPTILAQLEQLKTNESSPVILPSVELAACTMWSTINFNNMHVAHRGLFVGINSRDGFAGAAQEVPSGPDPYISVMAADTNPEMFLLLAQTLPSSHVRHGHFSSQQKKWLGLTASSGDGLDVPSAVPMPVHGWQPNASRVWAREPASELAGNTSTMADTYSAVYRVFDLGQLHHVQTVHRGDLMLDDNRVLLALDDINADGGDRSIVVLPLAGPMLAVNSSSD